MTDVDDLLRYEALVGSELMFSDPTVNQGVSLMVVPVRGTP